MENTTPFGLYYIDREYIEAMHAADRHIPNADYEDSGRARKFYCGPVMNQDGVNYYVPVSHEQKSMEIIGSRRNGFPEYFGLNMRDQNNEKAGSLDFRYMIPCVDERFLETIDPNQDLGKYGKGQAHFCQKYERTICNSARNAYENIQSCEYPMLKDSSIDFENAITAAWEHLDKVEERENNKEKKAKIAARSASADSMTANISTTEFSETFSKNN